MLGDGAMEITVNGKRIEWDSRCVVVPSGLQVPTAHFGSQLRFIAKEAREGYEHFQQNLRAWGLTVEDVDALQQSPEPVAQQLLCGARERVRCRRCHTVLWDPESIRRGIGPECRRRV